MKKFVNETDAGNEPAIKRGKTVPDGGINLAYAKSPGLSPEKNIVIVDTSRVIEENSINQGQRKLMFANSIGVLEDAYGNQIVEDEYPVVTDTFKADEDWMTTAGSEYTDDDPLPFLHVSRYFHLDFAGMTMGDDILEYKTEFIQVVDEEGRLYTNAKGKPRFKIKIVAARNTKDTGTQAAYRVYAYVDTDQNENLYLTYSKVELENDGDFKEQELSYRELLNPRPYFEYHPEESEVVDPANRNKKWYSTKPVSLKDQVLGLPTANTEGYKVYVPKKAINDPRIFQVFRWRVSCTFDQSVKVDTDVDIPRIRAGVVRTNSSGSAAPYAVLNMARSFFNATGVEYINPLKTSHSATDQEFASYWEVNMDTVSNEDLAKFDLLLWAPQTASFNFDPYMPKINHFIGSIGGTLYIDTNSNIVTSGLNITVSDAVEPHYGALRVPGAVGGAVDAKSIVEVNPGEVIDASGWGGWDLTLTDTTTNPIDSLTSAQTLYPDAGTGFVQYLNSYDGYTPILEGIASTSKAVTVQKSTSAKGNLIFSTAGQMLTASALFDNDSNTTIDINQGTTIRRDGNYRLYINSTLVEGAMKFLFNVSLLSVRAKILTGNESTYSTSWTYSTDWQSSWVIDASNDVLSDREKARYDFAYLPKDVLTPDPVWQRRLSRKTVDQLLEDVMTPEMKRRVEGATRNYVIEVTNSEVKVPVTLGPRSYPYAWTTAWTPKFVVPPELGAHIVKEDEVDAQYEAGQYVYKSYPAKPYSGQVRAVYASTSEFITSEPVTWTITGTTTETITISETVPPHTEYGTSEVTLSWADNGSGGMNPRLAFPWYGMPAPDGVVTWQEHNYLTSGWGPGHLNWPFFGLTNKYQQGSSGDVVMFIQDFLNKCKYLNFWDTSSVGFVPLDGYYGPATAAAVHNMQAQLHARYVDGVVDAESWSIIGSQILRGGEFLGFTSGGNADYRQYYDWPYDRIQMRHISDNGMTAFGKRSWMTGGPSIIWDMFAVKFNQNYDIHGVTVIPYVEGATPTLMVRSIDVRDFASVGDNLVNYNSEWSMLKYLPYRPHDGEELYIPFTPRNGNVVIVGIGQDGPAWNSSRMIGIRDIRAHAVVNTSTTVDGYTNITQQSRTIAISATGTADVSTGRDVVIYPTLNYSGSGTISDINWSSFSVNNPNVTASFSGGVLTLRNYLVNLYAGVGATEGPLLPGGTTYYSMDENGRINPTPENGWISKSEGIKLLCDLNGRPVGFPAMPTETGANETQQHFITLSLSSYRSDPSVRLAFYDRNAQEFIYDAAGESKMTFIEYMERGPQNIYIGVVSTYEVASQLPIPVSDNAPKLPRRWAMPVYGIYQRSGSRITLEALPPTLGAEDVWPVAVRTGKFNRPVKVRAQVDGSITTYLKDYQGTTVRAFYGIPEAELGGWSSIYGPPNADVVGEQPIILDDDVLQVRQAPIHMVQHPTLTPSPADPVRPVFTVYTRASVSSAWVALSWDEIADYNASTGEIFLKTPMLINDPALWKVDYVTARRHYYFKKDTVSDTLLNLNPYPGQNRGLIGSAIYIYIVPEYVKDTNGAVITASVQSRTLRFTTVPYIFDPLRPEYDPLAIQLGIVYISASLDINDLVILDTRRRGGGAKDSMTNKEVIALEPEAFTYWDIGMGAGMSYQKGGFIIVRLPVSLKTRFTEAEIEATIDRNITAGVRYKVEDLNGNDWS